jgi:hypothetical protein
MWKAGTRLLGRIEVAALSCLANSVSAGQFSEIPA